MASENQGSTTLTRTSQGLPRQEAGPAGPSPAQAHVPQDHSQKAHRPTPLQASALQPLSPNSPHRPFKH